jgi:hypothetical protein
MSFYRRSVKGDLAFGLAAEETHRTEIAGFVGCGLNKDPNPYAAFDFYNDEKTIYCELKGRRIPHDKYETCIITESKVLKAAADPTKTYYFFWAYEDGLFYLKYEPEVFSKFEVKPFKRFNRVDKIEKEHRHYFIPYQSLHRIEGVSGG